MREMGVKIHASTSRQTVYVVDDDPGIRGALGSLLEQEGYEVGLFSNAHEFLEKADLTNGACALVDIRMPEVSGLELQTQLCD